MNNKIIIINNGFFDGKCSLILVPKKKLHEVFFSAKVKEINHQAVHYDEHRVGRWLSKTFRPNAGFKTQPL